MKPLWTLAVLTLLLGTFSGCTGPASGEEAPDAPEVPGLPQLSGSVVDATLTPVVGAHVAVPSEGQNTTTDTNGGYRFAGLAEDVPLVVVVQAEGFVSVSKSLTIEPGLPYDLDFQLERVPFTEPYHETQVFQGLLSCAVVVKGPFGDTGAPCDPSGTDVRAWDLRVDAALQGVVVEVAWEPATEAAKDLNVTVETTGFGDQDTVLARAEGPSILRAQVPRVHADRYYAAQGGTLRLTVDVGADVDSNEAGSGAGVALQQDFQVFVTAFYHAPPPAGFTIAEA